MGALKLVGALALIGFTILFVLPTSMQLAFGTELPPYTYVIMAIAIGVPTAGFVAFEMWKTLTENRQIRRARRKLEDITQQSYGCIQPQILNSFVVFPVRVNRRGCAACSWVEMSEDAVVVNLGSDVKVTGEVDTEGPVRRLCEATFKQDLEVIVYCGGGTAGPTGLAVGVGRRDFGPHLASRVALSIKEAISMGVTST